MAIRERLITRVTQPQDVARPADWLPAGSVLWHGLPSTINGTYSESGTISSVAGPGGRAIISGTDASGALIGIVPPPVDLALTVIAQFRRVGTSAGSAYTALAGVSNAGGHFERLALNINNAVGYTEGTIGFVVSNNGTTNFIRAHQNSGITTFEALHTVVITVTSATTISMWLDGDPVTLAYNNIGSLSASPGAASLSMPLVGYNSGGTLSRGRDNELYLYGRLPVSIDDDEAKSLSLNPWQLFEPRRILVPVSVGGAGLTLTADTGSFTFTGNDTGLKTSRLLGADSGSFALTGNDANLVYTPVSSFTLTADSGSFALTGNDANLLRSLNLTADTGSFALTGNDANLVYSPAGAYTLTADTGTFTLTGNDASVLHNRRLVADTGSFSLTGIDVGLDRVRRLVADSVAFVLTGYDAALSTDGTVEATTRGGAGKAKLKKKKRRQLEATQDPAIIKVIHNLESEKIVDGRVVHETKQVIEPVVVTQETVESLAPVIETLKELVPPVVEAKDSITSQLEALAELVKTQNEEIQKLRKSVENLEEVVIVMLNT